MKQAIEELETAFNSAINSDLLANKGRLYSRAKSEYIKKIDDIYNQCTNDYNNLTSLLYKLISFIEALEELEALDRKSKYIKQDISTLTKERYSFIYAKTFFNSLNADDKGYKHFIKNKRIVTAFQSL